jgi:hypothetical protein
MNEALLSYLKDMYSSAVDNGHLGNLEAMDCDELAADIMENDDDVILLALQGEIVPEGTEEEAYEFAKEKVSNMLKTELRHVKKHNGEMMP